MLRKARGAGFQEDFSPAACIASRFISQLCCREMNLATAMDAWRACDARRAGWRAASGGPAEVTRYDTTRNRGRADVASWRYSAR